MVENQMQMKGQVSTPTNIVNLMVEKLFQRRNPKYDDSILDPGRGAGAFIKGILDWCECRGIEISNIIGVESDPKFIKEARRLVGNRENIMLVKENFLLRDFGSNVG